MAGARTRSPAHDWTITLPKPISVPGRRAKLKTIGDVRHYVVHELPDELHEAPLWWAVSATLLEVAEGRDTPAHASAVLLIAMTLKPPRRARKRAEKNR
jgi:hypothetical protein